jgi:hypothetical protein
MKLIKNLILKENIESYWNDNSLTIKDYTSLSVFLKGKFEIELKQELGYFINKPENVMVYRTYIKIFEGEKLIKRRLFYGDNGVKWKQFVTETLKENY